MIFSFSKILSYYYGKTQQMSTLVQFLVHIDSPDSMEHLRGVVGQSTKGKGPAVWYI